MSLTAEITVERSREVVWAFFAEPANWEPWWGGGLSAVQWRVGGQMQWALGGASTITAIAPGQMVQISGSWMDTTWTFEPEGTGRTRVRIEETPKGGASFSDGGAAHRDSLNSTLAKLKTGVESRPGPVVGPVVGTPVTVAAPPAVPVSAAPAAPAAQPQATVDDLKSRGDVQGLIAALGDPEWAVRKQAIDALGRSGDQRAVAPLVEALLDPGPTVPAAAAAALDKLAWQPDRPEQAMAYFEAKGDWQRCVQIGAPGVPVLVGRLQAAGSSEGLGIVAILGEIGDPRAVDPLIGCLKSRDHFMRGKAAVALGQIGDPRAIEPLKVRLQDKQAEVQEAAGQALDKLHWRPDKTPAGAAYWVAKGEWQKCAKMGAMSVEPLIRVLDGRNKSRCDGAALALCRIGDPRSVTPLISNLSRFSLHVRKSVAESLVAIYRSGRLDQVQVKSLLAQRDDLIGGHDDRVEDNSNDCGASHIDKGAGVAFPVLGWTAGSSQRPVPQPLRVPVLPPASPPRPPLALPRRNVFDPPAPPPVAAAAPAWAPTHLTPAGGMQFWAAPDARLAPAGQLPGNGELMLESVVGAWAQVRAANGWRGWVDGRLLVPRR
jgi:HEAT repeat protein